MPKPRKSGHSSGQCPEVKGAAKAANTEKQTITNATQREQHEKRCRERSAQASQWADDEVYDYIKADDTKLQAFTLGMLVVVLTSSKDAWSDYVNQGNKCVIKKVGKHGWYLVSCDGKKDTRIHGKHLCTQEEANELLYNCKHCTKGRSPSPDYYWCDGCIGYYEIY